MAQCDLCKAHCSASALEQLLPSYQVAGVEDICTSCRKWANAEKSKLLSEIPDRMQQAITERLAIPPAETKRARWLHPATIYIAVAAISLICWVVLSDFLSLSK